MPPVVYVGPTLDRIDARLWLPGAQLMPPIRRGDLYRDRLLGFTVFVILDGVFFERLAISPREIVDVIQSGGTVVGAASMGALRAAECWPAGMRGVGSIYRLYRRGQLTSDDDVAVAFYPIPPYASATVPLVNVRYAVTRALRSGLLGASEGDRIIRAAAGRHYTDRYWPSILKSAQYTDPGGKLLRFADAHDLKQLDGIRALKRVRTWISERPGLLTGSIKPTPTLTRRGAREMMDKGIEDDPPFVEPATLWKWLIGTGRYRRYTNGLAASSQAEPHEEALVATARLTVSRCTSPLALSTCEVADALARGRTSVHSIRILSAHDSATARAVWADITASGDIDAVVWRFRAIKSACEWARTQALQPSAGDWHLARTAIANSHGFRSWRDLRALLGEEIQLWTWIEEACEDMALAKRARYELFLPARLRVESQPKIGWSGGKS